MKDQIFIHFKIRSKAQFVKYTMNCPKIQQHLNLHQQIQFQQFVEFLDGLEVLGSEKIGQNFYKTELREQFIKNSKNLKTFLSLSVRRKRCDFPISLGS